MLYYQEKPRRWSRRFLIEKLEHYIDEYYLYFYGKQNWEHTTKILQKPDGIPDSETEIYVNKREKLEISFTKGTEWISLKFGEPVYCDTGKVNGSIEFECIKREGHWNCHMFEFNGFNFNKGIAGKRFMEDRLNGILECLQGEKMGDANVDHDAYIYKNCCNLLRDVYQRTIRMFVNGVPDEEGGKENMLEGVPFSRAQICNELFWDGFQGSTHVGEKLMQMGIDADKKISVDQDIFDPEYQDN